MEGTEKVVLHQLMTGACIVSVFASRKQKIADIPVGSDIVEARKTAALLMKTFKACNDFTDETTG